MAARIQELSNGHCSLEFETDELSLVKTGISLLWDEFKVDEYVASQSVEFGGCKFIFQNEWDDPCLIACSAEGNLLLRRLADHLAGKKT